MAYTKVNGGDQLLELRIKIFYWCKTNCSSNKQLLFPRKKPHDEGRHKIDYAIYIYMRFRNEIMEKRHIKEWFCLASTI